MRIKDIDKGIVHIKEPRNNAFTLCGLGYAEICESMGGFDWKETKLRCNCPRCQEVVLESLPVFISEFNSFKKNIKNKIISK